MTLQQDREQASPEVVAAVAAAALFARLPDDLRALVAASMRPVEYAFGDVVVRIGEPADALYLLREGRARVLLPGADGTENAVASIGPSTVFGEIGLLNGGTRTSTVRASSPLSALRLDGTVFNALVSARSDLRWHLEQRVAWLRTRDALRTGTRLRDLPPTLLDRITDAAEPVSLDRGEGLPLDALLVLRTGRLRVKDGDGRTSAFPGAGDLVGAAAPASRGTWTVEAVHPTEGWRLPLDLVADLDADEVGRALLDLVESRETAAEVLAPLDVTEDRVPVARPLAPAAAPEPAPEPEQPAVEAPADTRFQRGGQRVRRFRVVRQLDEMDCGAACLTMLLRHHGHAIRIHRARTAVGTGVDGTSMRGLVAGAEALGLEARGVKLSKAALSEVALPAITHRRGNHWVVVYAADADTVHYADPATGLQREPRAVFEQTWSGFAVLAVPTPDLAATPLEAGAAAALVPLLRRHRGPLLLAAVLAVVLAGLQLALPVAFGLVVDRALPQRDGRLLALLVAGLTGLLLVSAGTSALQRWTTARVAVRLDAEALDVVAGRLLSLPLTWYETRRTADVQRRLNGLRLVREFAVQNGLTAVSALAQCLVALVLLGVYSPLLLGTYLLVVPAYGALVVAARSRLRPLYEETEESLGRHAARQLEAVKGVESVKVLGAEGRLHRQLGGDFAELSGRLYRVDLGSLLYDGAVQLVAAVGLLLLLAVGARQVLTGSLTIGQLVAVNGFVALATTPLALLLRLFDEVQQYAVVLSRLDDVFGEAAEQEGRTDLQVVPGLAGRVELVGLGFSYGPGMPPVLDGVSLSVEPGETIALVGRSGCGKSTLLKLLTGMLEPTAGSVRYDGVDLQQLDHASLRRGLGVVLQETFLFSDTIARNIAFTDDEPDLERVRAAARIADADEFVSRLPMGYQTQVGENGLSLSGGQKQRLAIARAVYGRPGVLLLDEATSALDSESERAVQEGLSRLLQGRTAFVIAHRLSTIRDADRILVLERGRIVEQGTHDQLLAQGGLYAHLSGRQLAP